MSAPVVWVVVGSRRARGAGSVGTTTNADFGQVLAIDDGGVLLPVDAELVERPPNGAAGWSVRRYGAGYVVERSAPGFFCPLALWVEPGREKLSYAFAVSEEDANSDGRRAQERLRVAADTSRAGTEAGAVADLSKPELGHGAGEASERVFFGTGRIVATRPCLAGISLYGGGSGYRVLWFAASQSTP